MERIRLLQTSDLHLGIKTKGNISSDTDRIATLKKICNIALKHDILLVAGDMIHGENVSNSLLSTMADEFKTLMDNNIEIFYTPGRSEHVSDGTLCREIHELPVTRIFCDEDDTFFVQSSRGQLFIYGLQYRSSHDFTKASANGETGFHIGLFNAGFNPSGEKNTGERIITREHIKKMNLDYYAMGGEHNFRVFRHSNRMIGAYAGSPEPCTASETGDRFAVSIEIENDIISSLKRITVNTARIIYAEIECTGLTGEAELVDRIKSTLQKETSCMITLTGEREFTIGEMFKRELSGYFRGIDVTDLTCPGMDVMLEENSSGDNIQSEFFRKLSEQLKAGGGRSGQSIAKILRGNSSGRRILCDF